MKPALAVLAMSAAVLVSGCGAGAAGPDAAPAPAGSSAAPSPAPTSSSAAPPSAAPTTPGPTTPGPLTAADGTNLKACSDGRCEVIVEDGDSLRIRDLGTVKVSVKSDEVTLSQTTDGFSSTLTGFEGGLQQINKQTFLIVAVRDGKTVLRLRKA